MVLGCRSSCYIQFARRSVLPPNCMFAKQFLPIPCYDSQERHESVMMSFHVPYMNRSAMKTRAQICSSSSETCLFLNICSLVSRVVFLLFLAMLCRSCLMPILKVNVETTSMNCKSFKQMFIPDVFQ